MRCRRFGLLAAIGVLFAVSRLMAQRAEIAPRIAGPVDENSLITFAGHVPALARAEFDRGEASPSTLMSHVRLVLARSTEQQAALDKYDAELQDKSSPNYHKWLTPEEFGNLYGPADADIAAIVAWLEAHGLQLDQADPARTNISFTGTVGQIEETLHTPIHDYEANGRAFLSNNSNPSIPAALAPVISGVAFLNTLKATPHSISRGSGMFDPSTGRMKLASPERMTGPHPELTLGGGTTANPYLLLIVPGDAATIYDTPNSFNLNFPSTGTSYTGKGVTIGIGGDAAIKATTVASFRSRFVNDSTQPTVTNVDGVAANGDTDEAYLDTEISGGLAPGATIHFYTATSLDVAIQQMLTDNTVDIFSLSFGACELILTTAENNIINGWWQQAATDGIAVTVSTGDSGSATCDIPDTTKTQVATQGLAVSGFASTPYNVAVGGTDFAGLATSFTTYASPTSSDSPSTFYRTALKYIPESTWNDSVKVNGTVAQNAAYVDPTSGFTNIVAGAGGKSSCSTTSTSGTTTTCVSGYSKPTWQRGTGVPPDGVRDLPDVALMAGDGTDVSAWLACTDDTFTSGGTTYTDDCTTQAGASPFPFAAFGGTSAAAPAFAGMLALVQEKTAGGKTGQAARLGLAVKELYDLYNGSHASAIFHDITSGNNSVPCASGSPNCATNTAGNLFLPGYDTNAGYDLATGLGSVDATQLVTYWGTATGSGTTTVTVQPSATTIVSSAPLSVLATVKGSSTTGNPTGTVTLTGGGYTSSAQTLTASGTDSATYSFSVPGGSFSIGSDTLTVTYSGDASYASQTGTAPLTVNGLTPTVTVTPASTSINSGASLNVTATVTGTGGTPNGSVKLSFNGYTSTSQTLDSTGKFVFTVAPFTFAGGANTLTVTYSGSTVYSTASGTAIVNVTISTFTISANPNALTLTAGAGTGNTSTITVTPVAGYTGAVTLTAAVTSPPGAVSTPTVAFSPGSISFTSSNNTAAQTSTATVTTVKATAIRSPLYRSSTWFTAAGGTALAALLFLFVPLGSRRGRRLFSLLLVVVAAAFTVVGCGGGSSTPTKTTPGVTVSPAKNAISSTDTLSVAISVSGGTTAATGSVTLSGGGYTSSATSLSSGAATINIPANSLAVGSDTLTATYSGDSNYNSATGTASVTVNKPGTTTGAYTITVTGKGNDAAATTATTTFTVTVN